MKISRLFMYLFMVFAITLTACSDDGEDGMDGVDGAIGAQGPAGEDGNANVVASDWIDITLEDTNFTFEDVGAGVFTEEIKDAYVILVYGRSSSAGLVLGIPYTEGVLSYAFALIDDIDALRIIGTTSDGSNFNFSVIDQVRYVLIPPADVSGRSVSISTNQQVEAYRLQGLDLNDYDAVVDWFELEK